MEGWGCRHDDRVEEDGMAICTACGTVVDGLGTYAEDRAPGARPGGAGSLQPAGAQVQAREGAADAAPESRAETMALRMEAAAASEMALILRMFEGEPLRHVAAQLTGGELT